MKKLLYVGFAVASLFTSCKENVEEWHPNGPQTPPPGQEAVDYVKTKPKSIFGTADSEGIVGRPLIELQDRTGHRVIVKIKVRDFE